MALVFMFHAKLTPSLSLHRFSLHKTTFNVLNSPSVPWLFTLSAFISGLFVFVPADISLPTPLILCTKFLNDASFTLYLSLEGSEVWALSTCWWKRHSEGISVHKHKAIPYCSSFFLFSTMGSKQHQGHPMILRPRAVFWQSRTDVIPIWNNCEHLQCRNK